MSALQIRPYREGDESRINEAFNEVFGLRRSLAEWSWKFPPSPHGRLIMQAFHGDELVAHYAGVPQRFAIDGTVWKAAQVVDVFSKPVARTGFTRRGVWVQTVEAFFSAFGDAGVCQLLFGFPSPRPLRLGVLQLGYDAVAPQPICYLERRPPLSRATMRSRWYRAELARDWEPRLDGLWRRAQSSYPTAVVRDADYATLRLAGRPAVRYHRFLIFPRLSAEAVAFAAFRCDNRRCSWADLVWDHAHPGALELLAKLGGRLASTTGAELEEMWLNGDLEGQALLEARGFRCLPEPRQLVMVARAFDPRLELERLDGRVYLTMADSDLI